MIYFVTKGLLPNQNSSHWNAFFLDTVAGVTFLILGILGACGKLGYGVPNSTYAFIAGGSVELSNFIFSQLQSLGRRFGKLFCSDLSLRPHTRSSSGDSNSGVLVPSPGGSSGSLGSVGDSPVLTASDSPTEMVTGQKLPPRITVHDSPEERHRSIEPISEESLAQEGSGIFVNRPAPASSPSPEDLDKPGAPAPAKQPPTQPVDLGKSEAPAPAKRPLTPPEDSQELGVLVSDSGLL